LQANNIIIVKLEKSNVNWAECNNLILSRNWFDTEL